MPTTKTKKRDVRGKRIPKAKKSGRVITGLNRRGAKKVQKTGKGYEKHIQMLLSHEKAVAA